MEYRIRVIANGARAKNKGLISGRWTTITERKDQQSGWNTENFTIQCATDEDAFIYISTAFHPSDKRPLAGKSYLRAARLHPLKIGARVRTIEPYALNPETMQGYRDGIVTEIVSDRVVSIGFSGYHTQHVDFNLSELVAL